MRPTVVALSAPRILAAALLAFGLTACTTPGSPHPTYTAPAAQPETFAAAPTTATEPIPAPIPTPASRPAVVRGEVRQAVVTVPVLVPVLITATPRPTPSRSPREDAATPSAPPTAAPRTTVIATGVPANGNPGHVVDPDYPPTGSPTT